MPPKLRSAAEEPGSMSAGSDKPVEEQEETHMTEDGADLMALCSHLGIGFDSALIGAMASAELVTARNNGADEARQVKPLTGSQLVRSSKLVDTAVRGKKFEHALRLLATHAQQVGGLHSGCSAAVTSEEELHTYLIDATVSELRNALMVLMKKVRSAASSKGESKMDDEVMKSLLMRLSAMAKAESLADVPAVMAGVPEFVKVVSMVEHLEQMAFRAMLEGSGTYLGNGSYAQSQLYNMPTLFDKAGKVDLRELGRMPARAALLLTHVASRAVKGGVLEVKTKVREFEQATHEFLLLFSAGTLEQGADQLYDAWLDIMTVANRYDVKVAAFGTIYIECMEQLGREPPRRPKSAFAGCLDFSEPEQKMEARQAVERLKNLVDPTFDEMDEAAQVDKVKAVMAEADHKMGLTPIESKELTVTAKAKAGLEAGSEGGGERGRTKARSNSRDRSIREPSSGPRSCDGCGSSKHLLRGCDASDRKLRENGYSRGTDGQLWIGRGGVAIVCDLCGDKGHVQNKCPEAAAEDEQDERKKARAAKVKKKKRAEAKDEQERQKAKAKAKAKKAKARRAAELAAEEESEATSESDESSSDESDESEP